MSEPRSTWKGLLRLSVAAIPVRAYSPEPSNATISFHKYHTCHPGQPTLGTRIEQRTHCPACKKEVQAHDIHKGFEYERGKHVEWTDSDQDSVTAPMSDDIRITTYSPEPLDPTFIDSTLMLVPEKGAGEAFETIRQALGGEIMKGTMVMRGQPWNVAVAADEKGMILYRLRAKSAVRTWDEVMPAIESLPPNPAAVKLARQLLRSMSGSIRYDDLVDERQEQMKALIADKIAGRAPTVTAPAKTAKPSLDLMESLRLSIMEHAAPKAADQLKVAPKVARKKKTA